MSTVASDWAVACKHYAVLSSGDEYRRAGSPFHRICYEVGGRAFGPVPTLSGTLLYCFELRAMKAFGRISS